MKNNLRVSFEPKLFFLKNWIFKLEATSRNFTIIYFEPKIRLQAQDQARSTSTLETFHEECTDAEQQRTIGEQKNIDGNRDRTHNPFLIFNNAGAQLQPGIAQP